MYEIPTAIVVDDNKLTVQVLCDFLESINVRILGRGHSGKDAVELYKKHKPDILFLDLMMSEYDGFFALGEIRRQYPGATIVVVTSDLRKETEEMLDKLKPTQIIYKPFAVGAIADIVEKTRKAKRQ
jgi:chemotaxis response regulator CheB